MKLEMNDMQLLLVLLILPIAAFAVTANNAYGLTGWASMLELALAITNKHPNKSEATRGYKGLTPMVGCEWWGCGDGVVLARICGRCNRASTNLLGESL